MLAEIIRRDRDPYPDASYIALTSCLGSQPFDANRDPAGGPTAIFEQIKRGVRAKEHFRHEPWPSVSSAAKQARAPRSHTSLDLLHVSLLVLRPPSNLLL